MRDIGVGDSSVEFDYCPIIILVAVWLLYSGLIVKVPIATLSTYDRDCLKAHLSVSAIALLKVNVS